MEKIKLVIPTMEYKEKVMSFKQIFIDNKENMHGCDELDKCDTYERWLQFDERKKERDYELSKTYLALRIADNEIVGLIDCRLSLSNWLLKYGGHVGYCVLLKERKKGYAKEMLRLALVKYKEEGITKILVCCAKDNIASAKAILANGGVLENEVIDDVGLGNSGIIQRFWIDLKQ